MDSETKKVLMWLFFGFFLGQCFVISEPAEDMYDWISDKID